MFVCVCACASVCVSVCVFVSGVFGSAWVYLLAYASIKLLFETWYNFYTCNFQLNFNFKLIVNAGYVIVRFKRWSNSKYEEF